MIVNVNQPGTPKSAEGCMVALALKDLGFTNPNVLPQSVVVFDYEGEHDLTRRWALPAWVGDRIRAYDKGAPFEPFSFELPDNPDVGPPVAAETADEALVVTA